MKKSVKLLLLLICIASLVTIIFSFGHKSIRKESLVFEKYDKYYSTYIEYNKKKYYQIDYHPNRPNETISLLSDIDSRYRLSYYDFVNLSDVAKYDHEKFYIPNSDFDSYLISKSENSNNPTVIYHQSDIRSDCYFEESFDFSFSNLTDENISQIVITKMDDFDFILWSTDDIGIIKQFIDGFSQKEQMEQLLKRIINDDGSYRVYKRYNNSPIMIEEGIYWENEFHSNT